MKNANLIFSGSNGIIKTYKGVCVKFEKGKLYLEVLDLFFNEHTLKKIVAAVNFIHNKYNNSKLPIVFVFRHAKFLDKITYVLFECICEALIKEYGHKVELMFNFDYNIVTHGILSSPLCILSNEDKNLVGKNSKYCEKFNFDLYKRHYRRVIKNEEAQSNDKLSRIYDDIVYFQKSFNINYECIEEISEVIVELIANAVEHSDGDCLLDIDIAPNYVNKEEKPFCGINIAILNFSKTLLGDLLKERIKSLDSDDKITSERYNLVKSAYSAHKSFFNSLYDEIDFFNISSFQHKISGRKDKVLTGGIGLTLLIKSIEERADSHACYVVSGDRKIIFKHDYLEYNKDYWIGFNSSNNYLKEPPDIGVLKRSEFYMPGTAYNLNFVMKVNENE